MAEGRGREGWAHTANLMALLANANRDPKKRSQPYQPADFNPYHRRERKRLPKKEAFAYLKAAFVGRTTEG